MAHSKKLAGLALVSALLAVVVLAWLSYGDKFTSTGRVTVVAERAGLVMDVGAKVKYLGAEVGHVASIAPGRDEVRIELDLKRDQMRSIPENATARIAATTVFGAKYVSFETPEHPSARPLAPGDIVAAKSVTVEVNTVFEHLTTLLQAVEPDKVNATLGAISVALRGQGDALGEALVAGDEFLATVNGSLPALQHALDQLPPVLDTYADASPDLMAILDHSATTADTIVELHLPFQSLLVATTQLASSGSALLDANGQNLTTLLRILSPTTALLEQYSPEYTCLIEGLSETRKRGEPAFGLKNPGMSLDVGLVPGIPLYSYPDNLPTVGASAVPGCYGLPQLTPGDHAPYLVTDTGVNPYPPENTEPRLNQPSLLTYLFGIPTAGGN
ncbi:MCE family protein [Tomitella biformata]|uniref:MCE family protein n=1 Tax=Tomitella biformata TaxID=630403 RepID=UPI0004667300|nr:MCE family protein [Tomitella biformata]